MWIIGKDNTVQIVEVNTDGSAMAWTGRFPGVGDHGMHETAMRRQPGRPWSCFQGGEKVRTTEIRQEGPIGVRESDRLIVPVKAGNAAGGKEATHGRAM